ncbi:GDSL esterase/lipase [Ananas comosus]|uniref:GDSL esterase/lipase n=1 Tax=Ananas comosus TaxID=4615 RepID=A0A199W3E7_ANACO|nr:GDSL esterase/lipase [Ananas comosus]
MAANRHLHHHHHHHHHHNADYHQILLHLHLLLLSLITTLASSASASASAPARVPAIIVFGDSTVDAGNNNGIGTMLKSNFRPYAATSPAAYGAFCNGRIPPTSSPRPSASASRPRLLDPPTASATSPRRLLRLRRHRPRQRHLRRPGTYVHLQK